MNPNPGAPQNPFLSFLSQMRSQGGQQAPGQNQPGAESAMQQAMHPAGASQPGGAPVSAQGAGQAPGLPGVQQPEIEDAAIPGKNPGVSKNLLGAMNQLHGAITVMSDPQEIRMVRSIIVLLNQLIQRDQEVQNQRTGTFTGGQPGGQPAFSAGGAGGGAIGGGTPPGASAPTGLPTGQPAGAPNPSM